MMMMIEKLKRKKKKKIKDKLPTQGREGERETSEILKVFSANIDLFWMKNFSLS